MSYIDVMNVTGFDLNLLKAFAALYAERHVTRAAARIGLAQPSMSNALSRLRAVFDDVLFVKTPQGMVPTPQAEALAPKVEAALALVGEALDQMQPFDPRTTEAKITIAAPDNIALALAPRLADKIARAAPRFDLRFRPFDKDAIYAQLDRTEVDFAISRLTDIPARFHQKEWAQDRFVVIARKGHACARGGLTLERYCAADHVLVSFRDDARGAVDATLARMGRTRRIALVLAQFAVVPDVVAGTDYLSTIPETVAEPLARRAGCEIYALPFDQPGWTTQILWSAQTQANPAKRFAVEQVLAAR